MSETIASSVRGKRLALYRWDAQNPRAVVQIIHGMREHMGRYEDFARYLNLHGFTVYGHDHLGHGKSAGGEYGYFDSHEGARALVRDCGRVTAVIRQRHPELPVFLLGHSMGSFVGRVYILGAASRFSGFICMATGGPAASAPFARVIGELCSLAGGGRKPSRLLSRTVARHNSKGIPRGEGRSAWLSRDVALIASGAEDEHIRPRFTNRGFCDLFDLQMAANHKFWAGRVPLDLPILLTSGGCDPVGGHGEGVALIYEQLKQAGVRDVSCKLYDGARHEILNELNREEVYYDLLRWMESRL